MGGTSCERFLQRRVEIQADPNLNSVKVESNRIFKSWVEGQCEGTFT